MKIQLIDQKCMLSKGFVDDAGWDLRARLSDEVRLHSMGHATIPVGVAVQLPKGTAGIVKGRSSMAQEGILIMEGVIDEGYRGEIKVTVVNTSINPITIKPYQRIAQLVIVDLSEEARYFIEVVDKLDDSSRGENGFGSTGRW